ncbi:hypothetical protein [Psychromonas arctica]|uniref:hypothetical protein n=1 Tax=Psychromonas arctica TaxID=168275 RepID=UPI002FCE7E83
MNYKKISAFLLMIVILLTTISLMLAYKSISFAFQTPVSYQLENIISISRSPKWKYGKGFYVAVITLKKEGTIFKVNCKVHIGNENHFESIALGNVSSKEEAYSLWGKIRWTDTSLIIGSDKQSQVTVERSEIESHR